MKRVLVVGCGGAGKSTLARRMGELLGLPVVHLDTHFWRPGWVETPDDEWAEIVRGLIAQKTWILDGSYVGTMELRMSRADTVVFLDFSRWRCLWRVIQRVRRYRGRVRPDLPEGCPEAWDFGFLKWVWGYPRRARPLVLAALEGADRHRVFHLRSSREVERFVASLRA